MEILTGLAIILLVFNIGSVIIYLADYHMVYEGINILVLMGLLLFGFILLPIKWIYKAIEVRRK